ncbi:MAG: nucleotidyltransferase domain-containing protein [Spirochaetota bacterium]
MLQKLSLDGVEISTVNKPILMKELKNIANRIRQEHTEVKDIILFGSFSREDFTPSSDIDIAIIIDKSKKNFISRSDDFIDYFLNLPFDINLIAYTTGEVDKMVKEKNTFISEVLKGKRL